MSNPTTDRIRSVVHDVLGKPKPPEPDPTYPESMEVTAPPGAADDDLYLQAGGGFGSHYADAAEAARLERQTQQLRAEREARVSEKTIEDVVSPNVFLADRIRSLEERVAQLEARMGDEEQ